MKKLLSVLLVIALLLPAVSLAGTIGSGKMYVVTGNGKTLNVRSEPTTGDNIIGHLKYGAAVQPVGVFNADWVEIQWGNSTAYVQGRFLQWDEPKPKPRPTEEPNEAEKSKETRELDSEIALETPILIEVHTTRASGTVSLRRAPSKLGKRVEACTDGLLLHAFGETKNWYHATDMQTGKSGYIYKEHVSIAREPEPVEVETTAEIGKLTVNGEFDLQCRVPAGYKLQVISSRKTKIIATLTSDDPSKPQMMLTIAFDEMFAEYERMNDMSEEDIEALKQTFTDLNDVEFSEAKTGKGSKLLIAREVGEDEDFVSFISVYKGYSIEFVLTPNPDAADQVITDEQIQKSIEFLTDLDFIPVS